jgi:hypothetical protein
MLDAMRQLPRIVPDLPQLAVAAAACVERLEGLP